MNCPKHKKYKAVRKPTGGCLGCWLKWVELHPCKIEALDLLKYCTGTYKNEVHAGVMVSFLKSLG